MPNSNQAILIRARYMVIHLFRSPPTRIRSRRQGDPAELIIMTKGEYHARPLMKTNTAPVVARAGDVVYWPPGDERVEENVPDQPTHCMALYFNWLSPPPNNFPYLVHDYDGIIRILAERLLAMRDSPWSLPSAVRDAYVTAMLAECVRLTTFLSDDLVARVARFIEEHIAMPINLADLARHVGLERHYFGKKYKSLTGKSPMQHLRRRRVEHAMNILLGNPARKLKDVATRVGIGDERQLRRLIARHAATHIRALRRTAHLRKSAPMLRSIEHDATNTRRGKFQLKEELS